MDVFVEATTYTVNAVPDEVPQSHYWALTVEKRDTGRWAVLHHRYCLGTDGEWDYESIPSERTDEWLATHRFDLPTALKLAEREAPKVTINGLSAAAVLERHASRNP